MAERKEHTPGPWKWDGDTMYGALRPDSKPGDQDVECSFDADDPIPQRVTIIETDSGVYPPREADRALIASAPALLSLLEECRDEVSIEFGYDLRDRTDAAILAARGEGV